MLIATFFDSNSRTYEHWREDQLVAMASWCVRKDVDIEGLGQWAPAKYQAVEMDIEGESEQDFLLDAIVMFSQEYSDLLRNITERVREYKGVETVRTKGEALFEALGFYLGVCSTLQGVMEVMTGFSDDLQLLKIDEENGGDDG